MKTCCVTLRTDGDVKELVEDLSGVHNHPQIDDAMIEKQQVNKESRYKFQHTYEHLIERMGMC